MTAQSVETTGLSPQDARAVTSTAATAAAELVPSPYPLSVAPGPVAAPDPSTPAFVATFTGTTNGEVVLVLDQLVATALADATAGVQVEDAVRPALEAAAQTLGPCVVGPVRATTAAEVAGTDRDLVALLGDGTPLAWIGLTLRAGQVVPPVPRQAVPARGDAGSPVSGLGLQLLRNVELTLSVEIGRARMTVRDLLQLAPGSVVELDRAAGAPADLLVNGRLIARGEVVVVDEDFGLRITELIEPAGEASA